MSTTFVVDGGARIGEQFRILTESAGPVAVQVATLAGAPALRANGLDLPTEPHTDFVGVQAGVTVDSNVIACWPGTAVSVGGDTVQLAAGSQVGEAHTRLGTVTFNMPVGSDVFPGMLCTVCDAEGMANVNNITVQSIVLGEEVEDPATPGTYATGITMALPNSSATWVRVFRTTGSTAAFAWKVTAYFH